MLELTHVNEAGEARMVDVGLKADTEREAVATGGVRMKPETQTKIRRMEMKKGDVLAVARVAGIMAAKKTSSLIPLCHTLLVTEAAVGFDFIGDDYIKVTSRVKCTGKTGVEMEALTAVCVSCLTIYDMCKAIDRGMIIDSVQLEKKSGGKSGAFIRGEKN
ncbi:MAG: cyclic pyranopterin monophosphate synthase MoaC [Dehalococcoidia bacterium]|nr:cyclic pyranopterin monophosphate synthase MoaC [Dehalococcoidia bacterium]